MSFSLSDKMCFKKKLAHNRARTMEYKNTHEENRNCYGSLVVTFHTIRAGKSRIKSRFTSIKCFVCYLKKNCLHRKSMNFVCITYI